MQRRQRQNNRILKTAVITFGVLSVLSLSAIVIAAVMKNKDTNPKKQTEIMTEQEVSTSQTSPDTVVHEPDDKVSIESEPVASPNHDADTDVSTEQTASAAESHTKILPAIESTISGGKANKVVKKPKPTSDGKHTNVGLSAATTDANYQTVEGSYFDDAVFIGNSRTKGLMLYTGVSGTDLSTTGLNVATAYTTPAINVKKKKLTVMEALKKTKFTKAYIMFGVNEVGWMTEDGFIEYYRNIVKDVKAANPDAIIYIQSILPVTKGFEEERGFSANKMIAGFNQCLRALADEQGVIYLNIAEVIADKNGYLDENASPDGFHMNPPYYENWLSYLKSHAIVNE